MSKPKTCKTCGVKVTWHPSMLDNYYTVPYGRDGKLHDCDTRTLQERIDGSGKALHSA